MRGLLAQAFLCAVVALAGWANIWSHGAGDPLTWFLALAGTGGAALSLLFALLTGTGALPHDPRKALNDLPPEDGPPQDPEDEPPG